LDNLSILKKLLAGADGVLFDFDGVLADSEKYHFLSYREIFARHGHQVEEKEYYKYWTSEGLGAKGEIERYELDLDPYKIKAEKMPLFTAYCEDGSIGLFPEAEEILRLFAGTGKRLAVASGSSSTDIKAILKNAGYEGFFKTIVGSDIVPVLKPEPDVFLNAAERIGVPPDRCLVLEDAEKGLYSAINAGIPVIIIRSKETKDFDFSRADLVVDSTGAFLDLLRSAVGESS
jgi:beta-phosphoglucomutase-like phosphatase (HAD superfamily)